MNLGQLTEVKDLRMVWANEAADFTPWLAEENNLALLGETIGIELELEAQEKNIGPFRADIVCKDTADSSWVLIENQLEKTDHTHLGQLITYAAGLHAVTIIWIARRFTEEHRAALDWLNEVTAEDVNFFGLEIELWRIGDSPVAPKFNLASKPTGWSKSVTAARSAQFGEITETKQLQLEYWQAFIAYLDQQNSFLARPKPRPQHWMTFSIGRSGFKKSIFANTRDKRIGVQLYIHGGEIDAYYHLLLEQKDEIEQELGFFPSWQQLPHRKRSQLTYSIHNTDPTDRSDWSRQHQLLFTHIESLHKVFAPRIKRLDAADWVEEDLDDRE